MPFDIEPTEFQYVRSQTFIAKYPFVTAVEIEATEIAFLSPLPSLFRVHSPSVSSFSDEHPLV